MMSILLQTIREEAVKSVGMESAEDIQRNLKAVLGSSDLEEVKEATPFGSIFKDIFKDVNLTAEEEIEYSYFLYLSPEQLQHVLTKFGEGKSTAFIECKIPCNNKERKIRARQYYNDGKKERAELTTKIHAGDKRKLEYNSEISPENFLSMAWTSTSVTSRVRIYIPILNAEGKPIPRRGFGNLQWELDIYYSLLQSGFHPWVKIELEVSKAALSDQDIISTIPFDYEELMMSGTDDKQERKLIGDLYDNQYNMIADGQGYLDDIA